MSRPSPPIIAMGDVTKCGGCACGIDLSSVFESKTLQTSFRGKWKGLRTSVRGISTASPPLAPSEPRTPILVIPITIVHHTRPSPSPLRPAPPMNPKDRTCTINFTTVYMIYVHLVHGKHHLRLFLEAFKKNVVRKMYACRI